MATRLLDEENRLKLRALLAGLKDENAAYVMRQRSTGRAGVEGGCRCRPGAAVSPLPGVHWSYRVHEQILPALRRTGVDLRRSDVVIQHAGHEDARLRRRKLDRDLRLLLIENDEQPRRSVHPVQPRVRSTMRRTGRPRRCRCWSGAWNARGRAIRSCPSCMSLIAGVPRGSCEQPREALDACRAGASIIPTSELLFLEALLLRDWETGAAEATLLRLLPGRLGPRLWSTAMTASRGYKARHNLAVIYEETGRSAEAEAQWRAAVADNPQFTPGLAPARRTLSSKQATLGRPGSGRGWPGRHARRGGRAGPMPCATAG